MVDLNDFRPTFTIDNSSFEAALFNFAPSNAVYTTLPGSGNPVKVEWGQSGSPSSLQIFLANLGNPIAAGTTSPSVTGQVFDFGLARYFNGSTLLGTELKTFNLALKFDFNITKDRSSGNIERDTAFAVGDIRVITTRNLPPTEPDFERKSADVLVLDFPNTFITNSSSGVLGVLGNRFYVYENTFDDDPQNTIDDGTSLLKGVLTIDKKNPVLAVGFGEITSGVGFVTDERGTVISSTTPDLEVGDFVSPGDAPIITEGTNKSEEIIGTPGKDILRGLQGKDTIIGLNASDILNGGNGSDTLIGVDPDTSTPGLDELDTLTGENGRDTFVLGDFDSVFYDDENSNTAGSNDFAIVSDFGSEDYIQLRGIPEDYILDSTFGVDGKSGTAIFLQDDVNELIGFVEQSTNLNLNNSNDFVFI